MLSELTLSYEYSIPQQVFTYRYTYPYMYRTGTRTSNLTFQFNRNCFSHTALDPALKFCPLSTARPARLGKGPQSTSYRRSLASLSLHARAAASPRARCATTQLASTAPPPIGLSPTPAAGERPDARGTFCAHAGSTCSRPAGFTRGDYLYHHTTNHVLC